MAMNKQRRTANLNNIVTYDTLKNVTLLADLTIEGLTGAGFVKADANGLLSVDTGAYLPIPSQTGNGGKFLTTDGANLSWATVAANNIYTSNGTLTGNRLVTMGSYTLSFEKDIFINGLRAGLGVGSNTFASTAFGTQALESNTTGSWNDAFGYNSLNGNTTGYYNSAFGGYALKTNTTGLRNIGIGVYALFSNNSGNDNVSIGYEALRSNTIGTRNTATGYRALYASNNTSYNTAFGALSLASGISTTENSSFGYLSLANLNTGSQNTSIGAYSLQSNTSGNYNTAIGYNAGYSSVANSNTTGSNNIFVGSNSLGVSATESNRTWIGNSSTTSTWLAGSVLIGTTTNNGTDKLQVNGSARFNISTYQTQIASTGILFNGQRGGQNYSSALYAHSFDNASVNYIYAGSRPAAPATNAVVHYVATDNQVYWDTTNASYYWLTSGTNKMVLTTGGNVGIGTTNPQRLLHVHSTTGDSHVAISGTAPSVSLSDAVTGATHQAKFGLATAVNQFATGSVAGDFVMSAQTGGIIFAYNSGALAKFTTAGNLLIGSLTDGGQKLQVTGNATISGTTTMSGAVAINSTNVSTGYALFVNGTIGVTNLTLTQELTIGENFAIKNNGSQTIQIDANNNDTTAFFRVTTNANANELFRANESGSFLVGTTTENASAILQADSTTKGFLPPRMTGAQVEAIATPAEGLLVYATNAGSGAVTSSGWWGYNGTTWVKLN